MEKYYYFHSIFRLFIKISRIDFYKEKTVNYL
jgi:hypothetical protein